ncbi:MAG: orotidine-5'-phosphate decarboxylase [Bacillota bacterium]|nr:MAG: orotidine-5'-phosphate decarboxylase [Bacillota bacterium]
MAETAPQAVPFADRLAARIEALRSPVCVGIDPVLSRLPECIRAEAAARWGQTERGAGAALERFGRLVVDAVADQVAAVKLQSAFFEAYGAPGVAAFWEVVRYARSRGLLVIGDAKRGDIGSTAEAYADAFFGPADPGPAWADPDRWVDALTVNPYLGSDSLLPLVRRAAARGAGLFVLVKTSNPSAGEIQDQPLLSGETVAQQVAKLVGHLGRRLVGERGLSGLGAVVGATYPEDLTALREWLPRSFFLVPGYGAQGGTAADVVGAFLPGGQGALISASRSVIYAYEDPGVTEAEARDRIAAAAQQMNTELRAALARAGKGFGT